LFWKLRYIDNITIDDVSLNTIFGNAIHRVIQEWLGDILFAKSATYAKSIDLSSRFQSILVEEAKPHMKLPDGTILCSREELEEYYHQGMEIINYVQQNSKTLFPTENVKLVGIEYELAYPLRENLAFTGFIDIVTVNIETNEYVIYDLKTSRSGWRPQDKSDPMKKNQILLYKKFFSEMHDVPLEKIKVEYHILKRIVVQNGLYKNPRVTRFIPPNSKMSVQKAWGDFDRFLELCYDSNGNYITDNIKPLPSKNNCKYCPFKDRKDLCSVGVK